MKKIYTITFHRANNYGAVLQAYALQKVLINHHYNTEILDYDNRYISEANNLFVNINNNIIKSTFFSISNLLFYSKIKQRNYNFEQARKKMLISKKIKIEDLNSGVINKDSVFIVGSDQIWNPKITGGLDDIYTLKTFPDISKKISYAASTGNVDNIAGCEEELIERLKSIDSISVREKQLQSFLEKRIDKKVELVLDPTLLLSKDEWLEYTGKERIVKEKYIFTYEVANPNDLFYYVINELAKKTGYKIVYFRKHDIKNNYKSAKKSCYKAGPMEWLNLLLHSEYIVTTSFHGTALSLLLNKKPLVVLSSSSNRITSLLDLVKANECVVKNENDFERAFNQQIEWKSINNALKKERTKSIKWLKDAIEREKNGQK